MNYDRLFQNRYWLPKLGEITLSSLLIALISGILIIPGFQSVAAPFKSLSALVNSSLFGHFLHSCHAYAGDVFLAAMTLHVIEYLLKRAFTDYRWQSWLWLIVLLITGIAVVFSGFLSLGSLESIDATQILSHILNTLGALGEAIKRFFVQTSQTGSVLTILLHHASTFTVLALVLTYMHINRLKADGYAFYYTFVLIALIAVLFPACIGTHPQAELAVVKGPWYFRGLQEMLSWLPVGLSGIVFPISFLGLLTILPIWPKRQNLLLILIFLLFLFYLFETLIATFFRGAGWQLIV